MMSWHRGRHCAKRRRTMILCALVGCSAAVFVPGADAASRHGGGVQRRPISIEESVKLLKAAIKYEDNVLAAIGRAAPTQSDFTAAKASIFGAHYALVLIVQRGSQPGSAIRDDLNKALAYDSTASTTLDGNKTEGVASALAAARALKEKALTLLTTGEQPAPGATQHTVTEQLQITLVAPSASRRSRPSSSSSSSRSPRWSR